MRWLRFIGYFFRQAAENFMENPFLNLVAIGIISVTLFLLSGFLLVTQDLDHLFQIWGKGVRVIAYLDTNLSKNGRDALTRTIQARPEVGEVTFVSKDEALKRFKRILKGSALIYKDLAEQNPLPESLEVELKKSHLDPEATQALAQWLEKQAGVGEVIYGQEWLERFATGLNFLKIIGFILGGAMLLAAVFIVSSTIKVTLFARRQELEIMQLVGATDNFIKAPFVIEGSVQGFVGAALALLMLFALHGFGLSRLTQSFSIPEFPFFSGQMIGGILLGGMLLGASGSLISVGRFLRS